MIPSRAYNRLAVHTGCGTISKYSDDEKLKDEIAYYQSIHSGRFSKSISLYFPRLIESGPTELMLEFYAYPTLAESVNVNWFRVFELIRLMLDYFGHVESDVDAEQFRLDQIEMYQTKPLRYFWEFRNQLGDMAILTDKTVTINGKKYLNYMEIHDDVVQHISVATSGVLIHGDLCFSNMLYTPDAGIRLIDMRGRFGTTVGPFGDQRYDVAKLYHSTHGFYDALIRGQFTISKDGVRNNWSLEVNAPELVQSQSAIKDLFDYKFNEQEIKLIAGTIFIGMCSRHYEDLNRQLAMYLTGVRMLNEALAK